MTCATDIDTVDLGNGFGQKVLLDFHRHVERLADPVPFPEDFHHLIEIFGHQPYLIIGAHSNRHG